MTSNTTKPDSSQPALETAAHLFDNWFDPIEAGLRDRVHEFLHAMFEGELDMALSRPRYARCAKAASGEAEGAPARVIASGLIAMIKPFLKAFRDPLVGIRFALEARDLFEMPVGPSRRNAPLVLSFGAPDLQDRDRAGRPWLRIVIGHWSVSL